MSDFISKVKKAVSDHNMLEIGDKVIVGLSGGADSVCLLNSFIELKSEYDLTIYAAHLNHMLRGAEADSDEAFVRRLCGEKSIELFCERADIRRLAREKKISEELCGREVRYEMFERLSRRLNAKIATAHTASDNAETVIFNLTRGAGISGLSGIAPKRDNIIRPLIYVNRAEVEAYCAENALDFVTDSTNLSDDYTRNKLRHSVIPVLKELNPDFESAVSRECETLREVNSFLEIKADDALAAALTENGFDRKTLLALPKAVRTEALCRLFKENGVQPDYKLISLVDSIIKSGGAVNLGNGVRAVSKQSTLRFITDEGTEQFSEIELKSDTEFIYNKKQYSVKELNIDKKLVFRTRRAGDFIRLKNRGVSKTIKKLFNELHIPDEKRSAVMLAASGSEVFWIEGYSTGKNAPSGLIIEVKNI